MININLENEIIMEHKILRYFCSLFLIFIIMTNNIPSWSESHFGLWICIILSILVIYDWLQENLRKVR